MTPAIEMEGVDKAYGDVTALDDFCLTVEQGAVHAVLGPNGAGKTTAVRILTTLLRADDGSVRVLGVDVARNPHQVRAASALTGQEIAIDPLLTGRENLELIARLRRLDPNEARDRSGELLERFDLVEAADRPARTYSGGMKRRLDLAMSFVTRPRVLYLDEPTASLDPRSRHTMWSFIERFTSESGTTAVLTTQYLEEADRLADRVSIIDRGARIAEGTPEELKAWASGDRVEVTVAAEGDLPAAQRVLRRQGEGDVETDLAALSVEAALPRGVGSLPGLVSDLEEADVDVVDLAVKRPTLDDAFLALTGREAEDQCRGEGSGDRRRRSGPVGRGEPR